MQGGNPHPKPLVGLSTEHTLSNLPTSLIHKLVFLKGKHIYTPLSHHSKKYIYIEINSDQGHT